MNFYLRYLVISNTIFVFAESLFVPLYAVFVTKIGGNIELAGILFGLKFIVTTIVQFFMLKLTDKVSLHEKLLRLNFIIRGIAWFSLVIQPTITTLFIAQVLIGISEGIGSPSFQTLISENLDPKKHLKEWSLWGVISNSAVAIAGILSGFVITLFGFSTLFLIMSVLSVISLLVLNLRKK